MNLWTLKEENRKILNKLPENYREEIRKIGDYININNISLYNTEIVKNDLLNMINDAVIRGDDPSTIFGDNIKDFLNEVVKNLKPMNLFERISDYIYFFLKDNVGVLFVFFANFYGRYINANLFENSSVVISNWLIITMVIIISLIGGITGKKYRKKIFGIKRQLSIFHIIYLTIFIIVIILGSKFVETVLFTEFISKFNFYIPANYGFAFYGILMTVTIINYLFVNLKRR